MAKKLVSQTGDLYKKDIPKMPEGYYSGDKPNPNLRAFVEQHIKERPYDPETDDYDVPAFDVAFEASKATALYELHSYHQGKKPHDPIKKYIGHYTEPGNLVLDPFCGSGSTCLAALLTGREAIAIDRSPAATFIASNYCSACNVVDLTKVFEHVLATTKAEIGALYTTKSASGRPAEIVFQLWSQQFECPRCLNSIPVFDATTERVSSSSGKVVEHLCCPICMKKGVVEPIDKHPVRKGVMPVATSYICSTEKPSRRFRTHNDSNLRERDAFSRYDLQLIKDADAFQGCHHYPTRRMLDSDESAWGVLWRPYHDGIERVCDFFSTRNNIALASFAHHAKMLGGDHAKRLLFLLTSVLWHASKMSQFKKGGGGIMPGLYYVPPIFKEQNVLHLLERKFKDFIQAYSNMDLETTALCVSTQSATELSAIPNNSIDYVFTDPPYAGKVQYGEANFLWEAWLGFDHPWRNEEVIINPAIERDEDFWREQMTTALQECFRVLKPGRWLTLCYHDTSEGTWAALQDILAEVGFIASQGTKAIYIDARQKSPKQYTSAKSTQRDLVINFRKPKPGEVTATVAITGDEDKTTFNEKVRQIIRDYIGANPGCTKDRVYDEVVSRMVRSGEMEAHDFDELLRQVAEEVKTPVMKNLFEQKDADLFSSHEVGRWYLKEDELTVADAAETAREDAAADKLSAFIKEFLKKHPDDEGVHYSDLFEQYIYAVKDKPRRQLAEFLPDYFYKTEQGTWRLPASKEEENAKSEARVKGLGRRIKRYIAQLDQGVAIPDHERPNDATLTEWIRHCKRSGLYEQGKLLYEKGGLNLDNLTEEAMVNVEEDYQVCVRMLARAGGVGIDNKPKRGRKATS